LQAKTIDEIFDIIKKEAVLKTLDSKEDITAFQNKVKELSKYTDNKANWGLEKGNEQRSELAEFVDEYIAPVIDQSSNDSKFKLSLDIQPLQSRD
jgi:hypothetical protein